MSPSLPSYDSQQNIRPNTVAPLREEAAQPFQDQQKVLGAMQEITQKWSNANDVMQYTEAKAKHGLAVMDIESRAALDPDFKNSEKYHKELQAVRKDATSGISNQQVASRAAVEFDYDDQVAKIKIENGFRQKQVEYNKVMVKTNMDTLIQGKLSAATPAEAQQYDLKIEQLLAANVATNVLSLEEADVMLTKSQETAVKYEVYAENATQEKDSETLKELKKHDGKYSFLDPDTRLSMIEESQRRIFQNNQTFKKQVDESQAVRNDAIVDKMSSETLTFKDIDAEEAIPESQGGLPRKVLLQYKKYQQRGVEETLNEALKKKNPDGKKLTPTAVRAKEYNDLIEKYLTEDMGKWEAKELLAKALVDGQLDADELKILNPIKDNLKDIEFNKNTSPVAWAIKQYKKFSKSSNASSEDLAIRTKQMLKDIGAGTAPDVAMKKIMDSDMLKHFPDYKTYPKEGKRKIDRKTGKAFYVKPDGEWGWVESNKDGK